MKSQPGECDLLVKVEHSTLNYKDALVVTGKYDNNTADSDHDNHDSHDNM